jgi:hypothetical protein
MRKISFNNLLLTVFIIVFLIFFFLTKTLIQKNIPNYIEPVLTDHEAINNFYSILSSSERKIYSQNGEDGILIKIINSLKINNLNKYYVEIGSGLGLFNFNILNFLLRFFNIITGYECNTRFLRENLSWSGILFDDKFSDESINLKQEKIHHSTILNTFEKYEIPNEIDLLSEDTDYADYWIVEKILTKYRPKVLIHEVNQQTPDKCVVVEKSDQIIYWDLSIYHGGSVCAFYCLAKRFNYSMVYCESAGINCFWIRNSLIEKNLGINVSLLQSILNPYFLYKKFPVLFRNSSNKWFNVQC